MEINEYQNLARITRLPSAKSVNYAVLGLSGEVGELHSLIAKGLRDGKKPDFHQNIRKELGDILWFIASIADDFGFTLDDVAEGNLDKLQARQKAGTLQGSGDDR